MDVGLGELQPVFTWSKPAAGFYWKDVEKDLLPPRPWDETVLYFDLSDCKVEEYKPLIEKPTLFYDFANTEPTKEGILAFANRYGSLRDDASELVNHKKALEKRPPLKPTDPLGKVDAILRQRLESGAGAGDLLYWQQEIHEMSSITELLDYWQDKNKEGLKEFFIKILLRHTSGEWDFMSLWQGYPRAQDEKEARTYVRQRIMSDIISKAQSLLMFWFNRKIEGMYGTSAHLMLASNEEGILKPYYEPETLLNAIWLQLFQAVISASQGERRIKRCEICERPEILWEYGERKHRSNWHYHPECYNARKQKQYRDNKRQTEKQRKI